MLSFKIDFNIMNEIKDLSNEIALECEKLKDLAGEEKKAIHDFARVSMIGASTRIENAVLTDAEILWIDTLLTDDGKLGAFQKNKDLIENKLSKDRERSIEEVAGCRSMLFLIYEQAKDFFPLTEAILRGLHEELLKNYSKAHYYLGKYKTVPNSVIERNGKTGEERMVFKTADPGPITEAAMHELVKWYNETLHTEVWSVAVASELVFRFLAIHPFQDGNGRLGRGLFLMALLQSTDVTLSKISYYMAIDRQIERHKQEYYWVLQRCSEGKFHQDPSEYKIEYFLKFMIKILREALQDIEIYRQRYARVQKLSPATDILYRCFKEYPEKRLQTKDILTVTQLPRKTIVTALNTLLSHSLIQKLGQGPATRYQLIF